MYNISLASPVHPTEAMLASGASRSMLSVMTLLQKSGEFDISPKDVPDLLISYNNSEEDFKLREIGRHYKTKLVYSFRNIQQSPYPNEEINSYFTSTNFVHNFYKGRFNIESTVLPLPIIEEDVIATGNTKPNPDNPYLVIVNPSPDKGLYLIEAILEELWITRQDIPIVIFESRGKVTTKILKYGLLGVVKSVDKPREIYKYAKAVIMPSLWQEPAGRVIAESLLNSLPIAYSNRGGMMEVANGGGVCLTIPDNITQHIRDERELREQSKKWVRWISMIWDNPRYHRLESERNKIAGEIYLERNTIPLYASYFKKVIET
jgi:glycosyltransferase involved in cell wall biosynthesis